MTDRDFRQLQRDLEHAVLKRKAATDHKIRRDLLHEMRRLLAEADRFNLDTPE